MPRAGFNNSGFRASPYPPLGCRGSEFGSWGGREGVSGFRANQGCILPAAAPGWLREGRLKRKGVLYLSTSP